MFNNSQAKADRLFATDGMMLSNTTYSFVIGLCLFWGILLNILMATTFRSLILSLDYVVVLIVYFVMSLACMFIVYRSNKPIVSFLGFTGLSVAMGLLLTFFVQAYDIGSIINAFYATGVVVLIMVALSVLFRGFFIGIGKKLLMALIATIIVEVVMYFIGVHPKLFDFLFVLIFSGYIGYDWARAEAYPHTLDNAIDSAADIYVDIINIFIRILMIIGKSKSRSK